MWCLLTGGNRRIGVSWPGFHRFLHCTTSHPLQPCHVGLLPQILRGHHPTMMPARPVKPAWTTSMPQVVPPSVCNLQRNAPNVRVKFKFYESWFFASCQHYSKASLETWGFIVERGYCTRTRRHLTYDGSAVPTVSETGESPIPTTCRHS